MNIRKELVSDYTKTEDVVFKAFENAEITDHKEHILVRNLRAGDTFIPELSIVALVDGFIVGHIIFTKIVIKDELNTYPSLALAPVSVLPEYQNKGIGSQLIRFGLEQALQMNYHSVIVLGHHNYYPRFGFKPASFYGIKPPFDVSDEVFMALELFKGGLAKVKGTVIYPQKFYI